MLSFLYVHVREMRPSLTSVCCRGIIAACASSGCDRTRVPGANTGNGNVGTTTGMEEKVNTAAIFFMMDPRHQHHAHSQGRVARGSGAEKDPLKGTSTNFSNNGNNGNNGNSGSSGSSSNSNSGGRLCAVLLLTLLRAQCTQLLLNVSRDSVDDASLSVLSSFLPVREEYVGDM